MDVYGEKIVLSPDEMRDTGFPGELEISHDMLMAVRCSIAEEESRINELMAADDELSHGEMGRIHQEHMRQALRRSVAGEIANQLSIRDFLNDLASLPSTE